MARNKRIRRNRRGISVGTIVALALLVAVVGTSLIILTRVSAGNNVSVDTDKVLAALQLNDLPELTLSEIPIRESGAEATAAQTAKATAAPQATAAPAQKATVSLTVGGSLLIQSAVRKSCYYKDAAAWDLTELVPLLSSSMTGDLRIVTLEDVISDTIKASDTVVGSCAVELLRALNVNAVSVGFPNALDQGMEALQGTISALEDFTVLGARAAQDQTATVITVNGLRVALLHYTAALSSTGTKKAKKEDSAWMVPMLDEETAQADIAKARSDGADIVIVLLNWGADNKASPTESQKKQAQQLADAGADVILGTGTNVVQTATWLTSASGRQTLCCYSLGCLISDSRDGKNIAGMLLHLTLSLNSDGTVSFDEVSCTPTYVWRYKSDGAYHYRVVPSNRTAPDGMASEQISAMTRALTRVQETLDGTPVTIRTGQ